MPLLRDGRYYDALHTFMVADIDYWRFVVGPAPCRVLELGCGTGRVAIPLAREGHDVTGIDLSDSMIERATAKAGRADTVEAIARAGGRVRFVHGDMRELATIADLGTFDRVIAPFNVIRLLVMRTDLVAMLASMRAVLRPRGRFCLDVTMPKPEDLVPEPPVRTFHHTDPSDGTAIVATHVRRYEPATQQITLDATFQFADGRPDDRDFFVQRVYFPQELVDALDDCELDLVDRFGDYARGAVGPQSKQLLIVAQARRVI